MNPTTTAYIAIAIEAINQQISGTDYRLAIGEGSKKILVERWSKGTYHPYGRYSSLESALDELSGWDQVRQALD